MVTGPRDDNRKELDIARSLLPAATNAARAARKELRHIHRSTRQRDKVSLRTGDWSAVPKINDRRRRAEVNDTVRYRRLSDKLGPFYRWAEAITRDVSDPEARFMAVQQRLGTDTLQARHALDHLANRRGFRRPGEPEYTTRGRPRRPTRTDALRRRQLLRKLRRALAEDLAGFNRAAKRRGSGACDCGAELPVLVAGGAHDYERLAAFLDGAKDEAHRRWCWSVDRRLPAILDALYPSDLPR